jgi:uncharacterized protein YndB with AHSA1/START domain
MHSIEIDIQIAAPIESVFAAISDHAGFLRGVGLECRVVGDGQPERDGLGATREVRTGGLVLREDITRFDAPTHLDYVVRSVRTSFGLRLPIDHEGGWMVFSENVGVTRVNWRSNFSITIPLLGRVFEPLTGQRIERMLHELLRQVKSELESEQQLTAVTPTPPGTNPQNWEAPARPSTADKAD